MKNKRVSVSKTNANTFLVNNKEVFIDDENRCIYLEELSDL